MQARIFLRSFHFHCLTKMAHFFVSTVYSKGIAGSSKFYCSWFHPTAKYPRGRKIHLKILTCYCAVGGNRTRVACSASGSFIHYTLAPQTPIIIKDGLPPVFPICGFPSLLLSFSLIWLESRLTSTIFIGLLERVPSLAIFMIPTKHWNHFFPPPGQKDAMRIKKMILVDYYLAIVMENDT